MTKAQFSSADFIRQAEKANVPGSKTQTKNKAVPDFSGILTQKIKEDPPQNVAPDHPSQPVRDESRPASYDSASYDNYDNSRDNLPRDDSHAISYDRAADRSPADRSPTDRSPADKSSAEASFQAPQRSAGEYGSDRGKAGEASSISTESRPANPANREGAPTNQAGATTENSGKTSELLTSLSGRAKETSLSVASATAEKTGLRTGIHSVSTPPLSAEAQKANGPKTPATTIATATATATATSTTTPSTASGTGGTSGTPEALLSQAGAGETAKTTAPLLRQGESPNTGRGVTNPATAEAQKLPISATITTETSGAKTTPGNEKLAGQTALSLQEGGKISTEAESAKPLTRPVSGLTTQTASTTSAQSDAKNTATIIGNAEGEASQKESNSRVLSNNQGPTPQTPHGRAKAGFQNVNVASSPTSEAETTETRQIRALHHPGTPSQQSASSEKAISTQIAASLIDPRANGQNPQQQGQTATQQVTPTTSFRASTGGQQGGTGGFESARSEQPVPTTNNGGLQATSGENDGFQNQLKQASRATTLQQPQQTSQARPVHEQVRVHIQRALDEGNDRIRIQLHPRHLGRIEAALEISKSGQLSIVLTADRPETLDLLQRDQRDLQQALQNAGLDSQGDNLKFSLRGEGQTKDDDNNNQKHISRSEDAKDEETTTPGLEEDIFGELSDLEGRLNVKI